MDEQAYILDLSGLQPDNLNADDLKALNVSSGGRPWIGVQFECCGVYTRIYRNRQGTAYEGTCPRCSRPVRVRVGPGGTGHRLFRAG